MNDIKDEVMVTVLCTTYNHAPYIRDALEGIRMQKTDFRYDCFIFDDASTDGTSDIVREYVEKYPDLFRAYISPENTYSTPDMGYGTRIQKIKEHAVGKYIALCDTDDFWIDENKLQLQVRVMEEESSVSLVTHGHVRINNIDNITEELRFSDRDGVLPLDGLFPSRGGSLSTTSFLTRNDYYIDFLFDKDYPRLPGLGDYPLLLYLISKGDVYYINRIMNSYQYMTDGSWTERVLGRVEEYSKFSLKYIRFLEEYNEYTETKYEKYVKLAINQHIVYLACRISSEMGSDEDCDELFELLKESFKDKKTIRSVQDCYMTISGRYRINETDKEVLNKGNYVVVFGNGFYSHSISEMLDKNGIGFEGYLVSKKTSSEHYGKIIWDIGDYPYEKEKTVLVMGVGPTYKESVLETIEGMGFMYIAPLWVSYCEWL